MIFDSRAPEGTGQAVYLSATAEAVHDGDLDRALAIYPGPADYPGTAGRGLTPHYTREQLHALAPYRLYRATAFEH
ncbi:MAG: hypothetical protein ACHP9Z_32240, partial [Streptosporangiales bacterium]